MVVATTTDLHYVNIDTTYEVDIDQGEYITDIEAIAADENTFYILANKKDQRLGYYLVMIDNQNPHKDAGRPSRYLISWTNKLDFADANMYLMKEAGREAASLVVCFKSIGINTFNILVIDLKTQLIQYWHESF